MSTWLIVRHGETTWNAEERIQGQTDTPLSDRGYRQAELLGARLAGREIDAAYVSDLARAWETARTVTRDRDVTLTPSPLLRERSWGDWEGLTFAYLRRTYPQEYARFRDSVNVPPPKGESITDLMARTGDFVAGLNENHRDDQTLLIVGHGGCLNALITRVLDLPPVAATRISLGSASLTLVEFRGDRAMLKLLGDTSHWEGKV